MELGKMIGVIIICLIASVVICLANKDVFEGRGVANAIVTCIIIAGIFFGVVLLVWVAFNMIICGHPW